MLRRAVYKRKGSNMVDRHPIIDKYLASNTTADASLVESVSNTTDFKNTNGIIRCPSEMLFDHSYLKKNHQTRYMFIGKSNCCSCSLEKVTVVAISLK